MGARCKYSEHSLSDFWVLSECAQYTSMSSVCSDHVLMLLWHWRWPLRWVKISKSGLGSWCIIVQHGVESSWLTKENNLDLFLFHVRFIWAPEINFIVQPIHPKPSATWDIFVKAAEWVHLRCRWCIVIVLVFSLQSRCKLYIYK